MSNATASKQGSNAAVGNEDKVKVEISLDDPTGDFWIDNGLLYLLSKFSENETTCEIDINKALELLKKEFASNPTPVKIFIKASIRNLSINPSKEKRCSICGKNGTSVELKQYMYPFMVTKNKFSNFYSFSKGGVFLCPRCAISGLAGYSAWLYSLKKENYNGDKIYVHIFMFYSDMNTLWKLRTEFLDLIQISSASKFSNIIIPFHGIYVHEETFSLLLKFFSELKIRENINEDVAKFFEITLSTGNREIRLYSISGVSKGKKFMTKDYFEFSRLSSLYNLYLKWLNVLEFQKNRESTIRMLENIFRQFSITRNNNEDTLYRDKVCYEILNFSDPFPHIEKYLFEKYNILKKEKIKGLSRGTMDVFRIYLMEVLKMEEKYAKILAGFGTEIGKRAAEMGDMGVLYSLRNAKNIDEFLRVLNDMQFKLNKNNKGDPFTINEQLLKIDGERIMGQPWIRVKTLLSIYAMNSYLWETYLREKKKKGGA